MTATTAVRIVAAILILFPFGMFMGAAFPLGMKLAATNFEPVTPRLWGVNGRHRLARRSWQG